MRISCICREKNGMYFLARMKDKSASEMLAVVVRTLKGIEVKTMTYDNGTENTKHEEMNKILRQFFPKRTRHNSI